MMDLVLFQQAAERDHIRVTEEQLGTSIERQRQYLTAQLGRPVTDADICSQLTLEGLTWEAWVESLRVDALPEIYTAQVKANLLRNIPMPTDLEVQYYYRINIQQFLIGGTAEFRHVFVSTTGKSPTEVQAPEPE